MDKNVFVFYINLHIPTLFLGSKYFRKCNIAQIFFLKSVLQKFKTFRKALMFYQICAVRVQVGMCRIKIHEFCIKFISLLNLVKFAVYISQILNNNSVIRCKLVCLCKIINLFFFEFILMAGRI